MGECELHLLWKCGSNGLIANQAGRVYCEIRARDTLMIGIDGGMAEKRDVCCCNEYNCDP
jgi:hypothetical protein